MVGLPRSRQGRERAVEMQRLSALARTGPEGAKEAQRKLANIDRSLTVYDGANLREATEVLVKMARATERQRTVP